MNEKIVKVIDKVPGNVLRLISVEVNSLNESLFWLEYVSKHKPVIIKGAVSQWPALSRWKKHGYLEGICNDEMAHISRTFNPLPADTYFENATKKRKLNECLNEMRGAPENSTYSIPSLGVPLHWGPDIGRFSFLSDKYNRNPHHYPRSRLFIYKNAATEWHYHSADETLTSQLVGSKKISLFRLSNENWRLFSQPIKANLHHMSCGEKFFPQEIQIEKFEGVLDEGDAVYIPPFWWHGIEPNDTEFGITHAHCFRSPINRFGDWSDPITREFIWDTLKYQQHKLIQRIGYIAYGSLIRKLGNEEWFAG